MVSGTVAEPTGVAGPLLSVLPMRRWREERNITLRDLADVCGIAVSTLSRIERRQLRVSGQQKIAIAKALKVRVADLFGAV